MLDRIATYELEFIVQFTKDFQRLASFFCLCQPKQVQPKNPRLLQFL